MARAWQEGQNLAHVDNKAHVEHAVGLVEHRRAEVAEVERAALEQVFEPAGSTYDKRGLAAQFGHLRVDVGAADAHSAVDTEPLGKAFELVGDLERELARGHHDQHAIARSGQNFVDERYKKRRRFAGACVGDADDILAAQNVRDGAVLYRRRQCVPFAYDIGLEPSINGKVAELVLWVKDFDDLGNNRLIDEFRDVGKRRSLTPLLGRASAPTPPRLRRARRGMRRALRSFSEVGARLRREPRGSFMEP